MPYVRTKTQKPKNMTVSVSGITTSEVDIYDHIGLISSTGADITLTGNIGPPTEVSRTLFLYGTAAVGSGAVTIPQNAINTSFVQDHVYSDGQKGIIQYNNVRSVWEDLLYWGGDIFFNSVSGLQYGCIDGVDETIACATQSQWYQVTFDTAGPVHGIEADTTNNELQISKAGVYQGVITACFHSQNSQDWELMIKKTDGTVDLAPHLFQTTAVSNRVENTAGACLIDLTGASDRVELWVRCTSAASQSAVFDHVTLTLLQVGGT